MMTAAQQTGLKSMEAFRDLCTAAMRETAKQAKIRLKGEVAMAVRGDYMVANALIAPPKGVPDEDAEQMFLTYLSLPVDHAYATTLPNGYYTIERLPETNPRVRLVDLNGKSMVELPLNVRKMEMPPSGWSSTVPKKKTVFVQATIEQAQETLYERTRIQAHKVLCYPRDGVWYWMWA